MSVVNTLHNWHHDDYEVAKQQIHQQLGSLDDFELFGRQVMVAVYIRPTETRSGLQMTGKQQTEDVYQGKVVLLVKTGPDAFTGTPEYLQAMYGADGPPRVGDWLFLRSSDGLPTSWKGDGAVRLTFEARNGDVFNIYDHEGWPCRIVLDDNFIGRVNKPHHLI